MSKVRPIAMHLPQFHPIPENDVWWGKGFTEWRNVVNAKPRFAGHYQPHLPADLGFYDLRLEESRMAQEALAKEYGIHGFCYYHYWFNGKRILHEPIDRKMANAKEDFPFMLCWANENWTRAWDGSEQDILLKQDYSEADDRAHIKFLIASYFKDERYIKVDGKPIFCIYKPDLFPDIKRTLEIFREEAEKEGLELYLCWFERWIGWQGEDHEITGFDAAVEFQPLSKPMRAFKEKIAQKRSNSSLYNILARIKKKTLKTIVGKSIEKNMKDNVINYGKYVDFDLQFGNRTYKCFPGVTPMWDNSARRSLQRATILKESTPELFKKWYWEKVNKFESYGPDEDFIFINAWNEWAEGNHLEPCQKWGTQYLEALKK